MFGGFYIDSRQSNSISYTTPNISGFTLEIAQGLNEKANVPGTADRRKNQTDIAANYDAGSLHLGAGYEKIGDDKLLALRALYEFGALTVGGYLERDNFVALGKRNNARVSAMYTVGASEFHANIGSAGKFSNVADSKAQQYTLGYNYNLSKRTKVYGFFTRLNDNTGGVYGGDFNSTAVGIRHNF